MCVFQFSIKELTLRNVQSRALFALQKKEASLLIWVSLNNSTHSILFLVNAYIVYPTCQTKIHKF